MVRALILLLAMVLAGCASTPDALPLQARIAPDVVLTLPLPPGYPQTTTILQTGRAQYGDHQAAFEAVLSLAPERTEIVLTMLGGPRLATIVWDEEGVRETRSPLAPDGVRVENVLADIFMSEWPAEVVKAALPEGVTLAVGADGGRTISRGEDVIMTLALDPEDSSRTVVRNAAFGYEVLLVRQSLD